MAGGVGIESIECSSITKPKFELLALRLPGPGKCCVFTYDDQIFLLHKGKILTLSLPGLVLKQTGEFEDLDVWSSCEPVVRFGNIFWVANGEFLRLNLASHTIRRFE